MKQTSEGRFRLSRRSDWEGFLSGWKIFQCFFQRVAAVSCGDSLAAGGQRAPVSVRVLLETTARTRARSWKTNLRSRTSEKQRKDRLRYILRPLRSRCSMQSDPFDTLSQSRSINCNQDMEDISGAVSSRPASSQEDLHAELLSLLHFTSTYCVMFRFSYIYFKMRKKTRRTFSPSLLLYWDFQPILAPGFVWFWVTSCLVQSQQDSGSGSGKQQTVVVRDSLVNTAEQLAAKEERWWRLKPLHVLNKNMVLKL